jgi:hypothetical protein
MTNGPDERDGALLSALMTEHFVLQSARGAITTESTSRVSIYLATLSSALIAMGFLSSRPDDFAAFVVGVLPVIVLLGEFTFLRLVQIAREDIGHLKAIQLIRRHYRTLAPTAAQYFTDLGETGSDRDYQTFMQITPHPGRQVWLTAPSLIGVVNSIVAPAGVALLTRKASAPLVVAFVVAVPVAVVLGLFHARYQLVRWSVDPQPDLLPGVPTTQPRRCSRGGGNVALGYG